MYLNGLCFGLLMVSLTQDALTENTASFVALVEEGGRFYRESININLDANTVQYSNTKHRSTLRTRKIQDFNLGIQMICFPTKRRCFILQLNKDIYPNAQKLLQSLADTYNENGKLVFGKDSIEFIEKWYMTGKIFHDLTEFGPVIRDFHAKYGYSVYEVKRLPKNSHTLIDDKKNILQRRQLIAPLDLCSVNGIKVYPESKYGYTTEGCDYLTFCTNDKCTVETVRDQIYYVCLCCPYHNIVSECITCSKIY